jgi:hypothetical protein
MSDEQDGTYNGLGYDLRAGLTVAQALWELESTRMRLLEALESATERGLDPSLYGEAGLLSGHETQHSGWIRRWRTENGY